MTQKLRYREIPDVIKQNTDIAEIKKMVHELYERSLIPESMVKILIPTVHVSNIWFILELRIKDMEE